MIERILVFLSDMERYFPDSDRLSEMIIRENETIELPLEELYEVTAAGQVPPFVLEEKKEM